jgi:hypothetical protein
MFQHRERLGLGCRSRRAGGLVALAAAGCLAVAGCSGGSAGNQGSAQGGGATGTSSAGLALSKAPLNSEFNSELASPISSVVPSHPVGPPADPFGGTPADHWADGTAGIVLPAARPIGPFTKAQVAYAYQTTRKLLIASALDKQTLLGGAPTAFADLLTSPQKAWFMAGLNKKGVDKHGAQLSTRTWVMSLAPGSSQLIGSVIKVRGSMHAKAVKRSDGTDELDVFLDYLFVYPIEPPHQPNDWMRVVDEVEWTVAFGNWQGVSSSFAPWLAGSGASSGVAGAECGTSDGYSHPEYSVSTVPGAQPSASASGAPLDPYVAGQGKTGSCQATTGTLRRAG